MRITKLILQNINSLYGKWEIDFTVPEFAGGIFAITGKTGSGKTTILDAISLALFAETPRLSHDANREAVSRGTAECLAELTFESGGNTYLASFSYGSVKRGKNKGVLNSICGHRLSRNGTEIASGFRKVTQMVEEITGLNKERFCRTVMLAQGQFDSFLRAGDRNSEILEQITGTGIYSQIGETVRERNAAESAALERLEAENSGIVLLSDEEEAERRLQAAQLQAEAESCRRTVQELRAALETFAAIGRLEQEIAGKQAEQARWRENTAAFEPDRIRLEKAEQAQPAREAYEEMNRLSEENRRDLNETEALDRRMPGAETLAADAAEDARTALLAEQAEEKRAQDMRRTLAQVRSLDHGIRAGREKFGDLNRRRLQEEAAADQAEKRTAGIEEECRRLEAGKDKAARYCEVHGADRELAAKRGMWENAVRQLSAMDEEMRNAGSALDAARKEAEAAGAEAEKLERARAEADADSTPKIRAWEAADQALCEAESRKPKANLAEKRDLLKRTLDAVWKVLHFDEHRKQLKDGEPCPLCGSTVHPYAAGRIPEITQTEKVLADIEKEISERDRQEKELQDLERGKNDAEKNLMKAELAAELARQTFARKQADADREARNLDKLRAGYADFFAAVSREWRAAGLRPEQPETILAETDERTEKIRAAEKELQDFEKKRAELESEKRLIRQQAADAADRAKRLGIEEQAAADALNDLTEQRRELFGSRDPDGAEGELNEALRGTREKSQTAKERAIRAADALDKLKERRQTLQEAVGGRSEKLAQVRNVFSGQCASLGIPEDAYGTWLLPAPDFAELSARRAALAAEETSLKADLERLTGALAHERANVAGDAAEETVRHDFEEKNGLLGELQKKTGALERELKINEENKARSRGKLDEIRHQKEICAKWGALHRLIGQGEAFQRAAQGITLDNLLSLANLE